MALTTIGRRVDRLETLMAQLIIASQRTQRNVDRLCVEMREFKTEIREDTRKLKTELREFKDEMGEFKDEMREFKNEMREFKNEMGEFKDEMRGFKAESNKRWGELANKMGTMAEDLVAPSIERILRQVVGCAKEEVEAVAVRVRRRHPVTRQRREFDVVAACRDYALINETKSVLRPEAITEFVTDCLPTAREYFPEYANKRIIGAIASLYVDEGLVRQGERLGVIVLGIGEEVMDVLNSPGFAPKAF